MTAEDRQKLAETARRSLELIGEGEWTPQDRLLAQCADVLAQPCQCDRLELARQRALLILDVSRQTYRPVEDRLRQIEGEAEHFLFVATKGEVGVDPQPCQEEVLLDETCSCLDDTGCRQVTLWERCERCGAFMPHETQPCQECEKLAETCPFCDYQGPSEILGPALTAYDAASDQAVRDYQRIKHAEAEVAALRVKLAEAEKRASDLAKVSWDATQRRQAAEACAQRHREALWDIALGAWMEDAPRHKYSVRVFARRALSADPLVCRDPDLCWGKGTCPRDPACNE